MSTLQNIIIDIGGFTERLIYFGMNIVAIYIFIKHRHLLA